MLHQWGYLAAGLVLVLLTCSSLAMAAHYNVMSYGAKLGGETDSTKAFLATWAKACASPSRATMYIPKGEFLLHKVTFQGPCKNKQIFFRIDGSLVAPSDYKAIGSSEYWIYFQHVNGVIISGGTVDGKGASLWSCKASAKNCPTGATSLGFLGSQNIIISGVTSINSQMFHIAINGCQNVKIHGIKVSASGDSPNTDGIHVQYSTGVTIQSSRIGTGDDCISVGPGSRNLWIEHVSCGPGHGISIGSLGKELQEEGVQNVSVKTVTFAGTQNGVRIKSWARPSNGFVRDVLFQHVIMNNVQNPIIIDQNYCPDNQSCPAQASGIRISNVKYEDIHGTSATPIAVKLDCSKKNPCRGIIMESVHLTYENKPAAASCSNAAVTVSGSVQPSSCI